MDIQIPLDYETEKHRGFAFVEFESAEDAAAAIDNMVRMLNLGAPGPWETRVLSYIPRCIFQSIPKIAVKVQNMALSLIMLYFWAVFISCVFSLIRFGLVSYSILGQVRLV